MTLFKLEPGLFGGEDGVGAGRLGSFGGLRHLLFNEWRLLILQVRHYVGEELVAVVLIHWAKLVEDLVTNTLWTDDDDLALAVLAVGPLEGVDLVVLLEPHIHVELGKCSRQPERVLHSRRLRIWKLLFVLAEDEVVLELVDGEETLQAAVHVAVV